MSADDVENDLRGVLSQFSNAEKQLAERAPKVRPLYSITLDSYESLPYPIMRHIFYGRTIEEAENYIESHKKSDDFFRQCFKGNWQDIKCRHSIPVVKKTDVARIQATGRKKPGGLKTSIIGKMQRRKGG